MSARYVFLSSYRVRLAKGVVVIVMSRLGGGTALVLATHVITCSTRARPPNCWVALRASLLVIVTLDFSPSLSVSVSRSRSRYRYVSPSVQSASRPSFELFLTTGRHVEPKAAHHGRPRRSSGLRCFHPR